MRALGIGMVFLVGLAACAGRGGGGGSSSNNMTSTGEEGAVFKIFYPDQPMDGYVAKVGKRFIVKPVAACTYDNGRDARWSMTGARLDSGELPEGFTVEEGVIGGTPKAAGRWNFKVKFSGLVCAGKQRDAIVIPLTITAK